MDEFEYHLVENELNAKDFLRLKVASGKDTFYEKFGFSRSLGMIKYIGR